MCTWYGILVWKWHKKKYPTFFSCSFFFAGSTRVMPGIMPGITGTMSGMNYSMVDMFSRFSFLAFFFFRTTSIQVGCLVWIIIWSIFFLDSFFLAHLFPANFHTGRMPGMNYKMFDLFSRFFLFGAFFFRPTSIQVGSGVGVGVRVGVSVRVRFYGVLSKIVCHNTGTTRQIFFLPESLLRMLEPHTVPTKKYFFDTKFMFFLHGLRTGRRPPPRKLIFEHDCTFQLS